METTTAKKAARVEAARVMDAASDYLVRSRSQDAQAIAYSGTQAFVNLSDACETLRTARNNALHFEKRKES